MPQKRSNLLLWIIVGGGAFLFVALCLLAAVVYLAGENSPGLSLSGNQIASLDLEGVISDSKDFVDQLKDFGKRTGVKSVVIRINSPGGGVAASQEIYEAIKKFRTETKKKVVISMGSVAASGGYYVACGADKIFANPGTVTGSIGVIAEWYNYGDLLRWAKMENIVIKSGTFKDAGSGTRPLTGEEKIYFQSLINNMYTQFVSTVASSRKMKDEEVRKLADGRVYTGQEAKADGLVDELGTYQDAIDYAAKISGIEGEPKIVSPVKKSFSILDILLGESRSALSLSPDRSESHIRFQYLWR
ncbi:MAG TPA: signal peptide peptidase SppA [Acidobacteriota bacterium]|nr:signal peptide peptidase SppA [Acidobacteriota bacterium]